MAMASRCRLPARTGKCLVGSAASTSCVTSAPRSECRQRCGRDQRWPAAGRPQSRPARRSASGREAAAGGAARQVGQHVLDRHQALVVLLERGNPFQQAARVGSSGWSNSRATGASSTMRPAYITRTRSAVSETTPMLWAMTMIAMPNSSRRSIIKVEDLRLDGDVERSGGLVFSPPWRKGRRAAPGEGAAKSSAFRRVRLQPAPHQGGPPCLRRFGELEQLQVGRRDHALLGQRVEVHDPAASRRSPNSTTGAGGALRVCCKVRISNSSSMVPKPPGKIASALARIARCILRMAK